ncbi:MAG: hypothetical protein ACOCXJ_06880, partial [Planctomycetota bacterium]
MVLILKTPGQDFSYQSMLTLAERMGSSLLSWPRVPSIGSMAKTRRKLIVDECHEFQQEIGAQVTRALHRPRHIWGKRRIIGVDGSTFVVPRSADTLKYFRCPKGGENGTAAHHPRALMVLALDVLRR